MVTGELIYNKERMLKWVLMAALFFSAFAGYSTNTASFQKQHIRIELVCASNNKAAKKAFSYQQSFHTECKQPSFYTNSKLWPPVILIHNSISNVKFNAAATLAFSIKPTCRFRQLKAIPQSNCNCDFISVKG